MKVLDLEKPGTQKRQICGDARKKKPCKARFRTDLEDTMLFGGGFDHDHVEEKDRTIARYALRQTCKQMAVAEPDERPNQIITRSAVLVLYKIQAAGQGRAVKIYAQI